MTLPAIPRIETDRLVLCAPVLNDLPAVTAFFASEQSHWVGGPKDALGASQTLNATIGHWVTRGFGMWYVTDKLTNAWLGCVGFMFAPGWDEPELGWSVSQNAQGQGIAFEATQAARAYGAKHLNLDGVISYINPANTRSLRLAKRLEATYERATELLGTPCQVHRHPTLQEAA
ncbi:GNAT family N-acetyltransferase [Alisedimentitalea sp. MJ-SS2]|uniref:GNAT family N-acetyltransferase n=1 Tax=Aliisedimentitalea sp. MJ-SS2 TaxID=3049795 RepID=UPI00290C0934|nr:GNAT family N-acetyltransferase [Alisedimentitalea sp. MJ-SS2]MDU8927578.1 GNAT family N-acetyltransferase [Alisedimentitalea sp. MJ-SS2]